MRDLPYRREYQPGRFFSTFTSSWLPWASSIMVPDADRPSMEQLVPGSPRVLQRIIPMQCSLRASTFAAILVGAILLVCSSLRVNSLALEGVLLLTPGKTHLADRPNLRALAPNPPTPDVAAPSPPRLWSADSFTNPIAPLLPLALAKTSTAHFYTAQVVMDHGPLVYTPLTIGETLPPKKGGAQRSGKALKVRACHRIALHHGITIRRACAVRAG